MPPILTGWWRAAEATARLIAWPRTDVARADAAAAEVLGRSAIVIAAWRVLALIDRAWLGSTTRALVRRVARLVPEPIVLRTRLASVTVIVAGVTVLALQALKPGPREPLAWLLPTMTVAAAAFVAVSGALRRRDPAQGSR
jgi:hypothetical protein